jgi:hypothetical protein
MVPTELLPGNLSHDKNNKKGKASGQYFWGNCEAEITGIFCYVCIIIGLCHVASGRRVYQYFVKRFGSSAERCDSRPKVQSDNSYAPTSETNRNYQTCKVGSCLVSIRQSEHAERGSE